MKQQLTLAAPFAIIQFCWKEMTRTAKFGDNLRFTIDKSGWPGTVYIDEAVKQSDKPITFAEACEIAPTLHLRHKILGV